MCSLRLLEFSPRRHIFENMLRSFWGWKPEILRINLWLSWTILITINMASQGLIWCGFCVILYDRACCNDCTCSPNKIFKYSNIIVRNLGKFEYFRNLTFWCFEYSNIFVSQFFYIRIRILNIRPKIFEYSNIFEYSLRSDYNILQRIYIISSYTSERSKYSNIFEYILPNI